MRDLLSRLHIDPGLLAAVSAIPEETGEHYVGRENGQNQEGGGENLSPGILVEEIPGQVYPTEEVDRREEETASIESDPKITEPETTEPEITETETSEPETTEPESIQSVEPSKEEGAFSVGTGVLYTVREGDSLYSISRRFYGTEEMAKVIQQLNDLENADLIKVGQELLLP